MLKSKSKIKGSLTVEAAIIMPFFICVVLSFAFFMKIVYTQSIIQHGINETANELAVYSYLYSASGAQKYHDKGKDYLEEKSELAENQINAAVEAVNSLGETKESIVEGKNNIQNGNFEEITGNIKEIEELSKKNMEDAKKLKEMLENAIKDPKQEIISFASLLAQGAFEDVKGALAAPVIKIMCRKHFATDNLDADKRLKSLGVVGGLNGLDFSETRIFYDNKNIDIIVRYKVETGLPINLLPDLYFIQRANVHAWLDGDGKTPGVKEPEVSSSNVWELSVRERTNKIFEFEGKDTPDNVAIIKYNDGDIIDVTSIDLSEKSYIETKGVKNRINSSIRKLKEFESKEYKNIKSRTLIVIIPEKSLEIREDVKKLLTDDCLNYAKENGVILKFKEAYGTLPQSSV